MNEDLALARLAEVAAAHDDHAHDGERHCLPPGDGALIQAPAVPADEPLNAGVTTPPAP
jgi:hypothetical protein